MSARPDGAPLEGVTVVHAEHAVIGQVVRYHAPGTYTPPAVEGGPPDPPPIDQWCVELHTGDVLIWREEAFSALNRVELELLGGAAAGTEALLKSLFARAKGLDVPFGRTLELLGYAMTAQLAAIGRAVDEHAHRPPPVRLGE